MNQKFISRSILLIISIYSLLVSCTKELDYGSLVERNGIKYEVNSEKGYTGSSVGFHENGQKAIQCSFIDGKYDGQCLEWFDNGQLKTSASYSKGLMLDTFKVFFESGELEKLCTYIDGSKEGSYTEFWKSGIENIKGNYKDGLKSGEFLTRDSLGRVIEKSEYFDGLQHGETSQYWSNDSLKSIANYSSGIIIGEHTFFDSLGKKVSSIIHDSLGNKLFYHLYNNVNGNSQIITTNSYYLGELVQTKLYDDDGNLFWITDDSTSLNIDYKRVRLFSKGEKFSDNIIKSGYVEEYWDFDGGGVAKRYQVANDGLTRHGEYLQYDENGNLWYSGQYKNGEQTGIWKWFDKYGNVTNREYY